jgi:diguanylate cyclase
MVNLSSEAIRDLVHSAALPFYQPIVGGKSGVPSYEALGRLLFNNKVLTPAEFFPSLEKADAVRDFDWALLPLVIEQMGVWQETVGSVHVHVNVCAGALRSLGYLHIVKSALQTHNVPAHCLTIEVIENTIFWDDREMLEVITGLRKMGVGIAIDDVPCWDDIEGLLAWLRSERIGVQSLKVDHRLVRKVCDEGTTGAATEEFIHYTEFAHARGMKIIAEGIESETDLFRMDILGADEFQGNAIGMPVLAGSISQEVIDYKMTEHCEPQGVVERLRHTRHACV